MKEREEEKKSSNNANSTRRNPVVFPEEECTETASRGALSEEDTRASFCRTSGGGITVTGTVLGHYLLSTRKRKNSRTKRKRSSFFGKDINIKLKFRIHRSVYNRYTVALRSSCLQTPVATELFPKPEKYFEIPEQRDEE